MAAGAADGGALTLFLCGDVMTGRGIDQVLPHPCDPVLHEGFVASALDYVRLAEDANGPIPKPVDFDYVWGVALDHWARHRPDVRIVNLETSITRSSDFYPKGINYRMSPENAPCLAAAGFDCCVLANNHVLDWGRAGLIDTLANLDRLSIRSAGAGRDDREAAAPAVLRAGKSRVLVFSFAIATSGVPPDWAAGTRRPGINLLPDLSDDAIAAAADLIFDKRRPDDVVVVSVHWGANWGYDVSRDQQRFARRLIEMADVAVVHGHSSHHPKAIEVHRGRLVLYGCGDFLNDYEGIGGYEDFRGDLAVMYFASIDPHRGGLLGLEMVPVRMRNFRLEPPPRQDLVWMTHVLDREGRKFGSRVQATANDTLALAWST